MCAAWAQHDMFFMLHASKHACAQKIDDVEPFIQNTHVYTRHTHDIYRYMHACMSGTYNFMLNLVSVHVNLQAKYSGYEHVYVLRRDSPHDTQAQTPACLTISHCKAKAYRLYLRVCSVLIKYVLTHNINTL